MRRRSAAAWVTTAVLLAPLAYLVLGALHAPGGAPPTGWDVFPAPPTLEAFRRAFALVPLERQLGNSVLVASVSVPVSVVVASLAGFGLTLLAPGARRFAVGLVLVLLVVPASAVWVPRFVLLSEVGLIDTLVPLMLPALAATTPFAVLLFYWAFRRVPGELTEAAQLEGVGLLATWRMLLPLVRPTTVAVGAIVFALTWGNFVDALLYLYSPEKYTLPLGMSQLRVLGPADTSTVLAGACLVAAPPVIAFALVQRRFLDGVRGARWLGR